MRSLEVRAGEQRYEVLIGPGLRRDLGQLVRREFQTARCAIIVDGNVAPLFAETIGDSLRAAGFQPETIEVAPGESSKSIREAEAICEKLTAAGLDRSSFLVSLGGGMVGDLAGFVASIFLRGIPYVSVPTTLLAQVDSCIGGKTAVNSRAGKNLIGTFHQPTLVVADTDTLRTLPVRIWNEGFAEAIKHGIVRDPELFNMVAQSSSLPPAEDGSWAFALPAFVERNLSIKAAIVAVDEREKNDTRILLNFGHTIGHAIERAAGYGTMLHGEAISLGMLAAAHVSVQRAGLSLGDKENIRAALAAHHLPTSLPVGFRRDKIFATLSHDKKFRDGRIRFVVAHEIGRASVAENITMDDLHAAVETL